MLSGKHNLIFFPIIINIIEVKYSNKWICQHLRDRFLAHDKFSFTFFLWRRTKIRYCYTGNTFITLDVLNGISGSTFPQFEKLKH